LQSAYRLLMERATKLSDLAVRQSYLENVPVHKMIVQAAASKGLRPSGPRPPDDLTLAQDQG
jgi:hypothetical protein